MNVTRRQTMSCLLLVALPLVGGCVQRKLTVTSEPSGALVYLNDREVGRTPLTTDFLWYGDYSVVVRKEGYETIDSKKKIAAPWWQYMPFDFFAEISPTRPVDRHSLNFVMTPRAPDASTADLLARGLELQKRLPSTQPVATPGE